MRTTEAMLPTAPRAIQTPAETLAARGSWRVESARMGTIAKIQSVDEFATACTYSRARSVEALMEQVFPSEFMK